MRTSPAGKATRPRGFSLIELLVVVSILSVLALGVGLRAGGGPGAARGAVDLLIDDAARARERAILSRQVTGLQRLADGWQVMERGTDGWHPVPGSRRRAEGARWQTGGEAPEGVPPVLFLPQGQGSAFSVVLDGVTCRSDGWGPVTCG